jgi:hypothetical protein
MPKPDRLKLRDNGLLRRMKNLNDLSEIEHKINSNPIYALSLGSRELFHSNFIGWMIKKYPMMIEAILPNSIPGEVEVKREYRNLDLVIEFGEPDDREVVVIEVKVKDAPRLDQLKEYDDKIDEIKYFNKFKVVQKILLSLVEVPDVVEAKSEWRCLRFLDLGKRIIDLSQNIESSDDRSVIIRYYANLCCDLGALVAKVTEEDKLNRECSYFASDQQGVPDEIEEILERLRFSDTIQKQRASALCEEIKKQAAEIDLNDFEPNVNYGFDRKMSHFGAALTLKIDEVRDFKLSLGIHVQGRQYRRVLSFDGYRVPNRKQGKDAEGMKTFIDKTDAWKWMFGSDHTSGFLHKPEGQGGFFKGETKIPSKQQTNKLLCSYSPVHIYQYTGIGDDLGVPIDKVIEAVIGDLHYAAQLLADPDYIARFEKWLQKS